MSNRYTLTIYVAAPGTPLFKEDGSPKLENGRHVTSEPGHIFYAISEDGGKTQKAYGFAPPQNSEKFHWWSTEMPGNVEEDEHKVYRNPIYTRTMEISEAQFNALKKFGDNPEQYGFNRNIYSWKHNSCVDFAYEALSRSGIYKNKSVTYELFGQKIGTINTAEKVAMKVLGNIPEFEKIKNPYPNSELNRRTPANLNDLDKHMPDRTLWQWLLSEKRQQPDTDQPQYAQTRSLALDDMPAPAREICRQCKELLVEFDKQEGITRSKEDTDKIALAMGVKSYAAGLPEVQFIHIQKDGQINLGYESPQGMFKDTSIHTDKALATTLEENVTQSRQAERDFALAAEQRAREAAEYHAQSRGMTMG